MSINSRNLSHLALFAGGLVLVGCSSLPADLGRSEVDFLANDRGVPVVSRQSVELMQSLLSMPLTAEDSVRVALINNPDLKSAYSQLGFAAADVYEASRVRNPVISIAVLDSNRGGELNRRSFSLVASFSDILTLSARKRFAENEFLAVKQAIAARVLATAADTEAAYYRFLVTKQNASLYQQKSHTATLSMQLAQRYHHAGNLTVYELAIEQANASQARLDLLSAEAELYLARTELARLLGISVDDRWDVREQLPAPIKNPEKLETLLAIAKENRLDLAAARTHADNLANRLGVVNWISWLGELDIGIEQERETDGEKLAGPLLDWELPLFTQHRDAFLRADAQLQQAIINVARLAIAIENDVRFAFAAMNNASARANEYRMELIPARTTAVSRAQEEEAFMLIGIFELLDVKQKEYDSYQGYLDAISDYWQARAKLTRAVGNSLPGPGPDHPMVNISAMIVADNNDSHSIHNMKHQH